MDERRLDLGLSWTELADKAGLSDSTLRNIRRGRNAPSALNRRRLEDVLGWRHGSVEAILDGGEPEVAEAADEQPASDEKDWPTLRAELMQLVEQVDAIIERERRRRGA